MNRRSFLVILFGAAALPAAGKTKPIVTIGADIQPKGISTAMTVTFKDGSQKTYPNSRISFSAGLFDKMRRRELERLLKSMPGENFQ